MFTHSLRSLIHHRPRRSVASLLPCCVRGCCAVRFAYLQSARTPARSLRSLASCFGLALRAPLSPCSGETPGPETDFCPAGFFFNPFFLTKLKAKQPLENHNNPKNGTTKNPRSSVHCPFHYTASPKKAVNSVQAQSTSNLSHNQPANPTGKRSFAAASLPVLIVPHSPGNKATAHHQTRTAATVNIAHT